MFNLVQSGKKELHIADDVISCPSYNEDIAAGVMDIIEAEKEYGLYHLKNEGSASLYEFASAFFEKLAIPVKIYRAKAKDFSEKENAIKPLNTSIRSMKIPHLRNWQMAMDDFTVKFKKKLVNGNNG